MPKKLTNDEFIARAKKVQTVAYGYDRVNYVSAHVRVEIYCNKCQEYFWQTPNNHLRGLGCYSCRNKAIGDRTRSNTKEFIIKAVSVHGDKFGYDKTKYVDNNTKVEISCNKCRKYFWQIPGNHLSGAGCRYCRDLATAVITRSNTKDFIIKAVKTHGDKYRYDRTNYIDNSVKVEIYCKKCQKHYLQIPSSHLSGRGCPHCKQSHLELATEKYLTDKKISYEIQKKFKGCRNKKPLPFDFHLPDKNILIECQGEQHYRPQSGWKGHSFTKEQAFERLGLQCNKDTIKRTYAKKRGFKLIEISYKDQNKISELLDRELSGVPEHEQLELAI